MDSDYYNKLGIERFNRRDYEGAISEFEKAKKIDSEDCRVWYNCGLAYFRKLGDDLDKAIKNYNIAVKIKRDYYEALYSRGEAYLTRGRKTDNKNDIKQALKDFKDAINSNNSNCYEAWNDLGEVYFYMKEYDKAIESYNEALKIKPDYYIALTNRGQAYEKIGNNKKAIEDYESALMSNPNDAIADNCLGICLKKKAD